jgi:transglutaminase-like putative cysteine protease
MRIEAGFELTYECEAPAPMVLMLSPHPSRAADLLGEARLDFTPRLRARDYLDGFGNRCSRIVAPKGTTTISSRFAIRDSGLPDPVEPLARQHPVDDLPDETLVFLLASRYCETDRLMDFAWKRFGAVPPGWPRVQAVCDFVHHHLVFDYQAADSSRTATGALEDGIGVCRDFTHLAVTLCRCLNVPARYCTGYLGDIGVPPAPYPMDFSAWLEVWLDDRWYTFDARHNTPRVGRILVATGRDAADAALSTSFGSAKLVRFEVLTDEIADDPAEPPEPRACRGPARYAFTRSEDGSYIGARLARASTIRPATSIAYDEASIASGVSPASRQGT